MLVSALLALLATALPRGGDVHAPVPTTPLFATLHWPGLAREAPLERAAVDRYGADRAVLAGAIESEATTVSLIADHRGGSRSSQQWRDQQAEPGSTPFSAGAVACSERHLELGDAGRADDFHAYVVAAGIGFDLHATAAAEQGAPSFDRRDFVALVESLQISFPRRGTAANLPGDVRELMHGALCEWPRWREWLDRERRTRRDVLAIEFVTGELYVLSRGTHEQIVNAHRACLAAFVKQRTPSAEQRFAWMLSEESLGLALFESGAHADSIEPLKKSFEIADQIKSSERAAIAYNLARSYGATDQPAEAVVYLNEALAANPRYREVAARDRCFQSCAADKRFQALVRL